MRLVAIVFATFVSAAGALESPTWPPPGDVAARMRELQVVIGNPQSTAAQRQAAREELSGLLRSPGAPQKPLPSTPRAAIEPSGAIVKPAANPHVFVPVPGVATVDVVIPPRIAITPQTGAPALPAGRAAIDPRTGHILHETTNGYVDPRTGQFTPK